MQMGRARSSSRGLTRAQVRRMINAGKELKVYPRQLEEQSLLSSALCVVQEMSRIAEGDSAESRDGDKIIGKGLKGHYVLYNTAATPIAVRVFIIDTIADKYTAVGDDFTNNGSSNGPFVTESLSDIVAPLGIAAKNVLYDKTHLLAGLGDASAAEYGQGRFDLSFNHVRDFQIGDLGASDQSVMHNLRLVIVCRSTDGDATAVTLEYTLGSEYFFVDA